LTLATTTAVAAVMGLAISAAAKSQDQILPMLVISVMLSIVFCGGMIPVTGRPVLEQVSWAIPARWGFAATASTTDLRTIAPLLAHKRGAVVAPRWLVAARHDRTDPRGSRPGRLRALAHPAQRGTNSRSHRLVSTVHAAVVTSSDAAPVSAGMGARTTPLWSLPALGRQSSPSG
jgi:hypothetical protein